MRRSAYKKKRIVTALIVIAVIAAALFAAVRYRGLIMPGSDGGQEAAVVSDKESGAITGQSSGGTSDQITGQSSGGTSAEGTDAAGAQEAVPEREAGESSGRADGFTLTMLDVGQGLCVIMSDGQNCMIYDGGGRDYSSFVVAYLDEHGIDSADYIFASHYDEDHIAGLIGVMNTAEVKNAVCPAYEAPTRIYDSFTEMAADKGVNIIHPSSGQVFTAGDISAAVLNTDRYLTGPLEDENDYSLIVRVAYGDFSCILTGDAGREAEQAAAASGALLKSDIYVAGHHGSSGSGSEEFISSVSPAYAFISCGKDNAYGHPTRKTLNTFARNGIQIFRTDKQGSVSVFSDGSSYSFSTDPCEDWSPGIYTGF